MSFELKIKNGDISLEGDGTISIISGNEKIRQDIIKIILTELGENRFHPNYGSNTGYFQIGQAIDQGVIELDMQQSAESAIRYLIALQREQTKKQLLSSSEVIVDVNFVKIERNETDPRLYNIYISVITQKLETITESVTIRII
jgi:phage baseplate assembly protein W